MRITSSEFLTSAPDHESCPPPDLPEFAFIGRSNVGKSSLLNMLTKKELAKVSATPGHTKMINFFTMNSQWRLVDLPGYGFAKAAKHDKDRFERSVPDYLVNRPNLLCVFLLIDSMIPPQKLDLEFAEWMANVPIPFVLVFTKMDRMKPAAAQKNIDLFKEKMLAWSDRLPEIFVTSAKTGTGQRELLGAISTVLSQH
jgi:GTP-binding protein